MIKVNEKTIYFDPYDFEPDFEPHDADIIFITHPHYDHFNEEDIKMIMKNDTHIIIPNELEESCESLGFTNIILSIVCIVL